MQSVIGIDVSKGCSVGQAFTGRNKPFGKPFCFEHTKKGFHELLDRLQKLEKESLQRPWVVLEATGHYHVALVSFLHDHDYITVVVNPLTSQRLRKASLRKVKTDAQDAFQLAELFYKEEFEPCRLRSEQMYSLRMLTRYYEATSDAYVQLKLRFRTLVDQVFPLYAGVFHDLFSKTALELFKLYPSPQDVMQADDEQLTNTLLSLSGRFKSRKWAEEKAKKLMTAASKSPKTAVYGSHLFMLREMVEILLQNQEHLNRLQKEIDTLARNIKEYDLLRSIPGIGDKIAATILAEIGDIDQFEHAKKLVAFAGIDPSVFASGKFTASSNRITKRGSKRLRRALFLAVQCGLRGSINQRIREFYDRKRFEGKAHKVAIIACANKLLHVVFVLLKRGEPYIEKVSVL
jgi:transposase